MCHDSPEALVGSSDGCRHHRPRVAGTQPRRGPLSHQCRWVPTLVSLRPCSVRSGRRLCLHVAGGCALCLCVSLSPSVSLSVSPGRSSAFTPAWVLRGHSQCHRHLTCHRPFLVQPVAFVAPMRPWSLSAPPFLPLTPSTSRFSLVPPTQALITSHRHRQHLHPAVCTGGGPIPAPRGFCRPASRHLSLLVPASDCYSLTRVHSRPRSLCP